MSRFFIVLSVCFVILPVGCAATSSRVEPPAPTIATAAPVAAPKPSWIENLTPSATWRNEQIDRLKAIPGTVSEKMAPSAQWLGTNVDRAVHYPMDKLAVLHGTLLEQLPSGDWLGAGIDRAVQYPIKFLEDIRVDRPVVAAGVDALYGAAFVALLPLWYYASCGGGGH
jgi:hypothetical protein